MALQFSVVIYILEVARWGDFRVECKTNIVTAQNIFLAFYLMVIINGTLELGICNLRWKEFIKHIYIFCTTGSHVFKITNVAVGPNSGVKLSKFNIRRNLCWWNYTQEWLVTLYNYQFIVYVEHSLKTEHWDLLAPHIYVWGGRR
jgi:hypothetical protein